MRTPTVCCGSTCRTGLTCPCTRKPSSTKWLGSSTNDHARLWNLQLQPNDLMLVLHRPSGYPGFETTAWWAVFAPARLPAALAASLTGAIDKIVVSEAFRSKLEPLGDSDIDHHPTACAGRHQQPHR